MSKNNTTLPPLPALQAFEAAARHENFMAAAEELNLSQSAVSHRVRGLERHLGYALFIRLPRGLQLTENGKAYLPSIRRAFAEIMGSTSSIFGVRHATRIIISAPLSFSALWLSKVVSRFSADYPDVEIRMNSTVWTDHRHQEEADIELRLGYGNWPGYNSELLFRDRLVPLCSPLTFQTLPSQVTAAEIAKRPLVHIVGLEDQWGDFLAQHSISAQLSRRTGRISTDSSVSAAMTAAFGPHICLLAERFAEHFEQLGVLRRACELSSQSKQSLFLVTPDNDKPLVPEVELFRTYLRKHEVKGHTATDADAAEI